MKKLLVLILLLLVSSPLLAFAEGSANRGDGSAYYVFFLYYDNGTLVLDKTAQFKYIIHIGELVYNPPETSWYSGSVLSHQGAELGKFWFDPKGGNQALKEGKVEATGPFFNNAAKVEIYTDKGTKILTISVSGASTCNEDSLCDGNIGETNKTCPQDCKAVELTKAPTPSVAPPVEEDGGNILSGIIYLILGVLIIGFFWWKWRKSRDDTNAPPSASQNLSPETPTEQNLPNDSNTANTNNEKNTSDNIQK